MAHNRIYDIAIIGGGPAGATAAIALSTAGAKVALLERQPAPIWKIGETLSPGNLPLLRSLDILEEFIGEEHRQSHGTCSGWGSEVLRESSFIFNPNGVGWQLDRPKFEAFLLRRAIRSGAEVHGGCDVARIQKNKHLWEITSSLGTFRCRYVVDSSGRRAFVARTLGVRRITADHLVSVFTTATGIRGSDHDGRTLVESQPDGWWYSALMPSGKRTIAFQTDADLLPACQRRNPEWIREKVSKTQHLKRLLEEHGYAIGDVSQITAANSARLERCCGDGWVALGDAASSMDPLSGLGILKAMLSGQKAAAAVAQESDGLMQAYSHWHDATWEEFMLLRRDYYLLEQRWHKHPFWSRRQVML